MLHRLAGLALAVLALLVPASVAAAAPVTVNLRIEGATQTLFEGPVTTDAKAALATPSSGGPHPCDVKDNGANGGVGAAAGTPTTALADGAAAAGLPFDATFTGVDPQFGAVNDFFVSQIGPDVNQNVAPFASWGVALNFHLTSVGGCQIALGTGDDVLWAYDVFNKTHLLQLSGPTTATAGTPVTVTVVDGQNGAPVAGATVGGATTDTAGNARVTFAQAGVQRLKAEAPSSVRSNALVISVAAPGQVAAPVPAAPGAVAGAVVDRTAPVSRLLSPRSGHVYRFAKN